MRAPPGESAALLYSMEAREMELPKLGCFALFQQASGDDMPATEALGKWVREDRSSVSPTTTPKIVIDPSIRRSVLGPQATITAYYIAAFSKAPV